VCSSDLPGEVVLRIDACGICGSDLHASDNLPFEGLVMGHEFCGTVVDSADQASGYSEGDRVVGLSMASCGHCQACRDGRVRKCVATQMVGIERPGAYAEYVALPSSSLLRLPDALDHRHGALVEPLAVARHAVDRAGVTRDDTVAVVGAGPVGLAVTAWLSYLGLEHIVAIDPVAERRRTAQTLGATTTVDPAANDSAAVADAVATACGGAPTRVIECVGIPGMLQQSIDIAGVDGIVAVTGVCMAAEQVTPLIAMVKELDVRFAFFYRRQDMVETLAAMESGTLNVMPMISDEISLDELPGRFEALKAPSTDVKVLVRPHQ